MTTTIVTTYVTASTGPVYTLGGNDRIYVSPTGVISETGDFAALALNSTTITTDISIAGAIYSSRNGLSVEGAGDAISILPGGSIYAYSSAVRFNSGADHILYNAGSLIGFDTVFIDAATNVSVTNTGSILGQGYAVEIGSSTASAHVLNTGTLQGEYGGVLALGQLSLTNTGLIAGSLGVAIYGSALADTVTNSGLIQGEVRLGAGADVYDGSHGVVSGAVSGGAGDDVLTGGAAKDIFYGDNASGDTSGGADTLTGGYGDDVLNGGFGADTLYGNQDDDVLYGNQDNDTLYGGQGDDTLYGGQGNDTLVGGKGDDVMVGGVGDDTFVMQPGFGHDRVSDFRAGGANDMIRFSPDVFTGFADVQAHATATANGTLITDAAGDTLLLVGIAPGALTAAMFTFG